MGNVVALRPTPREAPATSAAFEAAWKLYPDVGRLRSSRKMAFREWLKVCRAIGEDAALGAVRRYVAEDKEHKKECGAPGFHRWLNWGRYEHWMPSDDKPSDMPRFPDEAKRAELVAAFGEDFVGSYLDPCKIDGTTLIVRTNIAVDRLRQRANELKALGFTGMRRTT